MKTILSLLCVGALVWASAHLALGAQGMVIDAQYKRDWAPTRIRVSLNRCPKDVGLYECVRDAMYRRDI